MKPQAKHSCWCDDGSADLSKILSSASRSQLVSSQVSKRKPSEKYKRFHWVRKELKELCVGVVWRFLVHVKLVQETWGVRTQSRFSSGEKSFRISTHDVGSREVLSTAPQCKQSIGDCTFDLRVCTFLRSCLAKVRSRSLASQPADVLH